MSRVLLAMSGGVDSSVAAHLLKREGHDVVGVFMRHGEASPVACQTSAPAGRDSAAGTAGRAGELPILGPRLDHKQGCCTAADAQDARRVADKLQIPFYALDLQEEFGRIVDYFVDQYLSARTPNPCVMCNNWIKFGKLFDYADSIGAQYVATGHYAQLEKATDGSVALRRGRDRAKDQSYVLFGIAAAMLPRMLLPVGGYQKPDIRVMAADLGFAVAEKRDSQEICFVTHGRYDQLVRARRGEVETAGEIVNTRGECVGHHRGIEAFTVGQRKKLGVAFGEPKFVVRIEPDTRRVVIGDRSELARRQLTAADVNWLVEPPHRPQPCLAKIRYNAPPAAATVETLPASRIRVRFEQPQYGVAPGQAVVCYEGDRVLGGAWIE